ncbi:MAG TPA: penicillin-binding protein 2 [Acidimicrobiales bacterium]
MTKQIRNLGVFLACCYTALFLQVNRLTVFQADALNNEPRNTRAVVRDFSRPRGTIETVDGVVVAQSVESNDRFKFQRQYPTGDLFAHVTGVFAFQLPATGVEKSYNDELAGRTLTFSIKDLGDLFVDRQRVGNVRLSLRNDVQEVAREALGDRRGSVVALDPRNGEILALWSNPSFDPNLLAGHDFTAANAAAQALNADPTKPNLARSYAEIYPPGSTFKVVTSTAGVEHGGVTEDSPSYPVQTEYSATAGGRAIRNFGGESCGGTLFTILEVSCNTAFAQMGVENAKADGMTAAAEAFGFDRSVPLDLPGAERSVWPEEKAADKNFLAQLSIGQNDVAATPLQMAMVAGAVANGGQIMTPHVMREIRDDQGDVVDRFDPEVWTTAMTADTAGLLKNAMIGVVTDGTASHLDDGLPGNIVVGGKTGTAQIGNSDSSHAWIIGFAGPEGEVPSVAVAVIVEAQDGVSEQTGGRVAAPIGAAVLKQALTAPARPDGGGAASNTGG